MVLFRLRNVSKVLTEDRKILGASAFGVKYFLEGAACISLIIHASLFLQVFLFLDYSERGVSSVRAARNHFKKQ